MNIHLFNIYLSKEGGGFCILEEEGVTSTPRALLGCYFSPNYGVNVIQFLYFNFSW